MIESLLSIASFATALVRSIVRRAELLRPGRYGASNRTIVHQNQDFPIVKWILTACIIKTLVGQTFWISIGLVSTTLALRIAMYAQLPYSSNYGLREWRYFDIGSSHCRDWFLQEFLQIHDILLWAWIIDHAVSSIKSLSQFARFAQSSTINFTNY